MNLYSMFRAPCMTALLMVLALPVMGADSNSTDEWQFDAAIYLWGASMDITPDGGEEISISFSDILDHLDMTFMGMVGARKGEWSLLTDVIYMNLSETQRGSAQIINQSINTKVDIEMEAWIVTAAAGYNLVNTGKYSLDLLGGARYISVDLPLKFNIGAISLKTSPSDHLWDGIIGVRGVAELNDNWYLNYYLDAGTGDSNYTWQGLTGLGYRFRTFDAGFGYRYLKWHTDNKAIEDLVVKGPYAGVRFFF